MRKLLVLLALPMMLWACEDKNASEQNTVDLENQEEVTIKAEEEIKEMEADKEDLETTTKELEDALNELDTE